VCTAALQACAITDGGRVACWGDGGYGTLGYGTNVDYRTAPGYVSGLTDAVQISCSERGNHVCAARANGSAVCWGHNGSGQLGDGSTADRNVPVPVTGLTGVAQVAAGTDFSCALLATGEVRCWGNGANGRLGRGSTSSSSTPVPVVAGDTGSGNLTGVAFIASGTAHACAVLGAAGNGRVVCWGYGANGRLGSGGTGDQSSPGFVHGLGNTGTCTAANPSGCFSNAVMSAAGDDVTLLVQKGGAASSFGNDTSGESGNGGGGNFPKRVTGVSGTGTLDDAEWVAMAWNHGCAVRRSSQGVCWGAAGYGRLGDTAGPGTNEPAPVPLADGAAYTQIDGGDEYSCGLLTSGTVRCWGHNWQGQIGDGSLTDRSSPVDVSGARGIVEADSGFDHTCVVNSSGAVYCAGWNGDSQLGTGDTTDYWGMARVQGITDAVDVASGQYSTCALRKTGGVRCWGYDAEGENGDGTLANPTVRATPIDVVGVSNAVEIAGGELHFCALVDPPPVGDGVTQVWCWGWNGNGQLGDGTTTNRPTPVQVQGIGGTGMLVDAVAIGAGWTHTCAVRQNGEVVCWGNNGSGQLGDNTVTQRPYPVTVRDVTGFVNLEGMKAGRHVIDGGADFTCAVATDGHAYCWGDAGNGEVGNGFTGQVHVPVAVAGGLDDYVRISAYSDPAGHACAVRKGGQAVCWGYNGNGAIGDGSTTQSNAPVRVHLTEASTAYGNADLTSPVIHVSTGRYHTIAVHQNGTASAWGYDANGRLGDGWTAQEALPIAVGRNPSN
jgi:alpha-tubulin suppressor-like RCC1 family protein